MIGLYAIAFLAPAIVFGGFGHFISRLHTQEKMVFQDLQKAMTVFVYVPLAFSYGVIGIAATVLFIQYLQTL